MTTFEPSAMTALIDVPVRYDLAESTSPPASLRDLGDLSDLSLGYGTSRGDADLRALIAAGAGVDPDQVLVTVGAIEAMFLLAQAVCAAGAEVILPTPCFPPARTVPAALGARVVSVPMSFDDGFRLPLERIAAALGPRTALVSLASPQNPSGVRTDVTELLALVDRRAPQAVVLVDETYRESAYGDAAVPASAAAGHPRVVTCSSLSKAHGAPGLRLGWLTCTDPALYARLREAKFNTTIACSTVDEHLGASVLRRAPALLAPRAARLRGALDSLTAWSAGQPVELVVPDGGALCCLRMHGDPSVFYPALAEQETRVAPGSWFGADDRIFRLGFGHLPPDDFAEALDRLGVALRKAA
jgi:aspartate/methionine/tyrosine aminotransferase